MAVDLSDGQRVIDTAQRIFGKVDNALSKPYVEFPLTLADVTALDEAYGGTLPPFIQIQQGRRPYWRGEILVATEPRPM